MKVDRDGIATGPSLGRRMVNTLWQQPLWALPFGLFFGLIFGGTWEHFVTSYKFSLIYAYTIRIALELMEAFVLPRFVRPKGRHGRPGVPVHWSMALYSGTSILASYVAAFIIQQTLMPGMLASARSFLVNGAFALVFSTLFGGISYAIHYYRESMRQARAIERMRTELAQAENRALRAQIQPHFLFNTLNSIASLIPSNPVAAEEMTTRLADIFRYALRASERESAPLGEELEFLRAYLAIERARFGDRLQIEEQIAPDLADIEVPSLLLQPLVENAVRHGIAPRPEGGRLVIAATRDGDHLVLAVEDDGPGFDPAAPGAPGGNGFGLHSVRERLRALGLPEALTITNTPDRGVRVAVRYPIDGKIPSATSAS